METRIVKDEITKSELRSLAHQQYGDIIKAVVDIEQGIMGVGGELHVDIQSLLMERENSQSQNTWGINLYLEKTGEDFIEFDSMINLKPAFGNKTRGVEDVGLQQQIRQIVDKFIK